MIGAFFPPLSPDSYAYQPRQNRECTVFDGVRIYLIRASPSGPERFSSALLSFCLLHPPSLSLPSHRFSSRSARAETLMKTNARNQFAASSLHLAGVHLCASISTAAGEELLRSSPITHTSVLWSSYRPRLLLREERCLKLSSENLVFI